MMVCIVEGGLPVDIRSDLGATRRVTAVQMGNVLGIGTVLDHGAAPGGADGAHAYVPTPP